MHKWSSGRIVACHAIDPGSIPGLCTENFFLKVYYKIMITRFKWIKRIKLIIDDISMIIKIIKYINSRFKH